MGAKRVGTHEGKGGGGHWISAAAMLGEGDGKGAFQSALEGHIFLSAAVFPWKAWLPPAVEGLAGPGPFERSQHCPGPIQRNASAERMM